MNTSSSGRPQEGSWYQIRLQGRLAPRWSAWFDGLTLTVEDDGTTTLSGLLVDQAALHGHLHRLRDLGLPLISVSQVSPEPTSNSPEPQQNAGEQS